MVEKFSYHESLLGLTHVVGLADGENQKSETDTKVHMIMHEQIPSATIEEFQQKQVNLGTSLSIFEHAIETLKTSSKDQQLQACAWMYSVAIMASSGSDGELDYDHDKWISNSDNVNESEKQWVEKAITSLSLEEAEVKKALLALPEITRI